MVQLVAMPSEGERMIYASFQAGQVGMLDISDRSSSIPVRDVSLGSRHRPALDRPTPTTSAWW